MELTYDQLKDFIKKYYGADSPVNSSGGGFIQPEFELYPEDYIVFAEQELDLMQDTDQSTRRKINCISHLKRALDC